MKSTSYIIGFVCGLAIVALVALISVYVLKRKSFLNGEYDERQQAVQGKGYKYALFTNLIIMALAGIAELLLDIRIGLFVGFIIGMWPALCVFATYCIAKDAYIALQTRRKTLILIFSALGAVNLSIGLNTWLCKGLMENGALKMEVSNLATGVGCLYVAVALIIKICLERRSVEE